MCVLVLLLPFSLVVQGLKDSYGTTYSNSFANHHEHPAQEEKVFLGVAEVAWLLGYRIAIGDSILEKICYYYRIMIASQ